MDKSVLLYNAVYRDSYLLKSQVLIPDRSVFASVELLRRSQGIRSYYVPTLLKLSETVFAPTSRAASYLRLSRIYRAFRNWNAIVYQLRAIRTRL